jgi:hypothetical protein
VFIIGSVLRGEIMRQKPDQYMPLSSILLKHLAPQKYDHKGSDYQQRKFQTASEYRHQN